MASDVVSPGRFSRQAPSGCFFVDPAGIILLPVITACCLDLHHDKEKRILPDGVMVAFLVMCTGSCGCATQEAQAHF